MTELDLWLFLRVLVAFALGGMVGYERERHNQPAGFRTHMLVSGGSAMFVVASLYGFASPTGGNTDVSRVAAQIVTGVGFLGAGSIWRSRGSVRGLTTAASIWIVAAIGMLAGTGHFAEAAFGTLLTLVVLRFLRLDIKQRRHPEEEEEEDAEADEERVMRSAVKPPNTYRSS